MERPYQQCAITVMDTIADDDIRFDDKGICNYYYDFKRAEQEQVFSDRQGREKLNEIVAAIKEAGKNKPYDCIMGLSGGVDSTYVAYQAKQLGLRPLAVHFDNGWNSELAVKNIENIVSRLQLDLHTLVVDWEEFKDIQLSYMKASVVDIEVVSDHGIFTTLYKLAKKHKIKYILSGNNVATEYIMPRSWLFNKMDHVNLRSIHKQFGTVPFKTYPVYDTALKKYINDILQIKTVTILNYLPYNKKAVKELIAKELGWKDYGGKHYESIFTKFYQAYILPTKFHIDKRKAHLSTLICSGQMTKEDALKELAQPLYTPEALKLDYEYVLKKLGLGTAAFEAIMKLPPKKHTDYPIERGLFDRYPVLRPLKPLARMIRKA
jgi:N-acetyl sugar amidotransferase